MHPLTTTEGISSGSRSTEVSFEVSKQLKRKDLAVEEFSFQLLDPNGLPVWKLLRMIKMGKVKFKAVKFLQWVPYKYQIKEVNDQNQVLLTMIRLLTQKLLYQMFMVRSLQVLINMTIKFL